MSESTEGLDVSFVSSSSAKKDSTEIKIPRTNTLSRRSFLKLAIAAPVVTFVACSRNKPEIPISAHTTETIINPNTEKAQSLFAEVGITDSFVGSNPQTMYDAAVRIAHDKEFDTKLWRIFKDQNGEELGLALDQTGEAIPLRRTASGEVMSVQGLNFALIDANAPHALFTHEYPSGKSVTVVGYEADRSSQILHDFISLHPAETKALMEVLFAHSAAERNILHLPDDGMPNQVFSFPDTDNADFQMPQDRLPDTNVSGSLIMRYINETRTPTRADIFLSAERIRKEAELLALPYDAMFAGYLANEAYGVATETYRIQHNLPIPTGRYEAASTGADWATTISMANNFPNPFFTPTLTQYVSELSEAIMK